MEDYGGFQTQFTAIMETILQTAVREATKLFQLSLQHLKAELLQLRQENGKLATGELSMGVKGRITAVGNKTSDNISKYRDIGVQCGMSLFAWVFFSVKGYLFLGYGVHYTLPGTL